jgi:hypothetical protein
MDPETQTRIDEALAAFDGQETSIMAAGRENTKTVNRLARFVDLKRVGGEKTFQRNISRYSVEGAGRDVLIGAERAGGGVWRLIARWGDE